MATVIVDKPTSVSAVPIHAFPQPKAHEHPQCGVSSRSKTSSQQDVVFWSFVAGALTGGMEALITYPIEYVKTNLQLQQLVPASTASTTSTATPHVYHGIWDCVNRTVQQHSPLGLYRGFFPVLLGSIPKQASRWAAYEWATDTVKSLKRAGGAQQQQQKDVTLSLLMMSACGFFAGCVEAVCAVAPTESVKTRMIHDAKQPCPRYSPLGTVRAVQLMLQENGVRRTFYSGVGTTMVKQGLNQSLRFPAQKLFMDALCCCYRSTNGGDRHTAQQEEERWRRSPLWNGVSGFFAGVFSVLVTQPVDVVKTQLQSGAARHAGSPHMSCSCCYRAIYRQRGIFGFYAGAIARSVHVGTHVALTFTVFPVAKRVILSNAGTNATK
ncbi:citrate transporter [Trypanosoma grayi]|uniref:citrate transporter n=1 Tax=Trypanosoma grayi TaxID=71804 RepID=UPI0004F45EC5|nr:citrate transporter [Trypanosoma grayi]KEG10308.1 citrate transporter [Trypanosoma grayi]